MNRHNTWLARSAAVAVAAMATACGPSAAATSSADHAPPGQSRTVPASRPIPNVCDSKIVAPGDLADVLAGPITAKTLPGDPQTCEFSANDYSSISITVRPGLGDVTVSEWTGGKMPVDAGPKSHSGKLGPLWRFLSSNADHVHGAPTGPLR